MDFAFADGRAFFCGLTGVGAIAFGVLEDACAFSVSLAAAFGSEGPCEAPSTFYPLATPLVHQVAKVLEVLRHQGEQFSVCSNHLASCHPREPSWGISCHLPQKLLYPYFMFTVTHQRTLVEG
jgi:hypothetical protein